MYYIIRKDIRVKHDEIWDKVKAKDIYCGVRICNLEHVEVRKRKITNGVHIKVLFFNTSYL